MVIGLDEIVGKEYCIRANVTGLLQVIVEKGVATIKLLHCKNKKYMYMYFLKLIFNQVTLYRPAAKI